MANIHPIICIGAGPAGLTAAYQLAQKNEPVIVLESDAEYVGGIARTVRYKGFHFDVGGHRFFSKSKRIEDFWTSILGSDLLVRSRKSRIFYKQRFFTYPLRPLEALNNLGLWDGLRCAGSYLWARLFPVNNPRNFAEWVSNRFGRRLFEIFFRTYTEKVWGMPCAEISSDWAAQRIQGVSPWSALMGSFRGPGARKGGVVKSLISSFRYPRKGPGMMWEAVADRIKERGGQIIMDAKVAGIRRLENHWELQCQRANGETFKVDASRIISTMALRELMQVLQPLPASKANAANLRYRDFIMVALILKGEELFDDNWIYVHEESVKVGRVQNFRAASPEMVPDPSFHCYGMEYFCFENDSLWESPDASLIELASDEIQKLGLAKKENIVDGYVVRQPKAYPVYDETYKNEVQTIRLDLEKNYSGLHIVGRNGMHKYNNQDHSMMTAMLAVENILAGKELHDVWNVNHDAEYLEAVSASDSDLEFGLRVVPERVV